jgi:hypothetical protein
MHSRYGHNGVFKAFESFLAVFLMLLRVSASSSDTYHYNSDGICN